MLPLVVNGAECFDEALNEFVYIDGAVLQLEHSLISVSKWESKWHRSFLNNGPKNRKEKLDYIRCMTINKVQDNRVYTLLSADQIKEINDYINDPMTATSVKNGGPSSRAIVTSELIYYWMTQYGIPFECEKWHLNRLMMLIRVCGEKSGNPKKMSQRENMQRMHAVNEARKARLKSRG